LFGEQALAGHEAQGGGKAGRGRADLVQRGDDLEVERARVNLADGEEADLEAEMLEDAFFEAGDLGGVAFEESELVELGADRALEAAHGIAGGEFVEAGEGGEQLLAKHGEAFAEGGGLGRHVGGAAGEHEGAVLLGALGELLQGGGGLEADDLQRAGDLELLDVFGEVARGEAEVDGLAAGESVEGLDAGLDVVESDAFAGVDVGEVDLALGFLVVGDGGGRDGQAEVALGLHDGDPVIALYADASGGGPDVFDEGRGVAFGEDVGNGGHGGGK